MHWIGKEKYRLGVIGCLIALGLCCFNANVLSQNLPNASQKRGKEIQPACSCADAEGAIAINDSIYGPATTCTGFGKKKEMFNVGHTAAETNSIWFKFTVSRDELLEFNLVPLRRTDDYDFALFRCPDSLSVANIAKGKNKPVRFNFSANSEKCGSTGLSVSADTFAPPGFGPHYVAALRVKRGDQFYLMVNLGQEYMPNGSLYHGLAQPFTLYFNDYWPLKKEVFGPKKRKIKQDEVRHLYFEVNQSYLSKANQDSLIQLSELILHTNHNGIEIAGYADSTGDVQKNKVLSAKRAEAVKAFLIAQGVEATTIATSAFGSEGNKEEELLSHLDLAKMRRVDIKLKMKPGLVKKGGPKNASAIAPAGKHN